MYIRLLERRPLAHAGKHGFGAHAARRLYRYVPYRSTKCLGGFRIDIAGEYYAVALRRQVHTRGVGFIREVDVMRMCQCRTLPRRKFLLHRLFHFY
jgi:hypothetical protein